MAGSPAVDVFQSDVKRFQTREGHRRPGGLVLFNHELVQASAGRFRHAAVCGRFRVTYARHTCTGNHVWYFVNQVRKLWRHALFTLFITAAVEDKHN